MQGSEYILTNQTTAPGVYSVLNGKVITDWTVENMNPDMMLLDASVSITLKRSEITNILF